MFALLFTLAACGTAAAQLGTKTVAQNETWETYQIVENLVVTNQSTLTVRGAILDVGSKIEVHNGSALVLESTPDASARIQAWLPNGWQASIQGRFVAHGLPGQPVLIEGIGGYAARSAGGTSTAIAAYGGITVSEGEASVRHARFTNYNVGLIIAKGTRATLTDVEFESPQGMAIVGTRGDVAVDGLRAVGGGGGIFLTQPQTALLFSRVSFRDTPDPLTIRQGSMTLRDFDATGASTCLTLVYPDEINLDGFRCHGFSKAAIESSEPGPSRAGIVRATRIEAGTDARVTAVVYTIDNDLTVTDSRIGPSGGSGIVSTRVQPHLANVTFERVSHYNVVILGGSFDEIRPFDRLGDSGTFGWMIWSHSGRVRIVDPSSRPLFGAVVEWIFAGNGTAATHALTERNGTTPLVTVPRYRIDAEGRVHNGQYRLVVQSADGTLGANVNYLPPEGPAPFEVKTERRTERPSASGFETLWAPGILLFAGITGMGFYALARRRRQRQL